MFSPDSEILNFLFLNQIFHIYTKNPTYAGRRAQYRWRYLLVIDIFIVGKDILLVFPL